ncbi:PAS domain-containing protein [bacterium]|nr:PAS domain-containing protein [bacterium]
MRNTGINIVGEAPWGTHFCLFYRDRRELLDIIIPYLKAGLDANEYCIWIAGPELAVREAKTELARAVPRIDHDLKSGRLEILSHADWYLQDGDFRPDAALEKSLHAIEVARQRGFDGVRITGDATWIGKIDWDAFSEYEQRVNTTAAGHPMLALCAYCIERLDPIEVLEVMRNHQFALVRKQLQWDLIESSSLARTKRDLEIERDTLQTVMNGAKSSHLVYLDRDFNFVRVNETYARGCGYTPEQMAGINIFALYPGPELKAIFERVRDTGESASGHDDPFEFPDQPERGLTYWDWTLNPVKDPAGHVIGLIFSLYETTKRKQAELDLQLALGRLELAYRAAGAGAWDWNIVTGKLEWSDKMFALLGLDPHSAEASFETWRAAVHPDDLGAAEARIEQAIKDHAALASEYRIVLPGGEVRWINAMGEANYDDDGRPIRMTGICTDVTERKQAEEELRRNREWLSVTLASIGDAVIAVDRADTITFFNPVAAELTGWPTNEALGRPLSQVFQIIDEQTNQAGPDAVGAALAQNTVVNIAANTVLIRRDGSRIPIEDSAAPIRDGKGNVAGVVLVFHDVTEKRRAQEALRESENEIRLVMDSVPALIAYAGPDMCFRRVNKGFEKMVGKPADQIVGHHVREVMGAAAWPRIEQELKRVYAGETVISEHRLDYADGKPWGQVIIVPDRDPAGRVQGHVVHIMDISQRKQAEEELADLQRRQAMILDSIADGFFAVDRNWRIIHINEATLVFYGKTREAVIGRPLFEIFPEMIGSPFERTFKQAMETGEPVHFVEPSKILKNRVLEVHAYPGADNLTVLFRDVTERTVREAELRRLNRTLNALSHSDSAMMRATDEAGYVAEVCRIVTEQCGHALVWVGYALEDEAKTVRPMAFSGFDREYIDQLNISWGDNERGHGPTGTAIRSGRPYICRNIETDPTFGPWRERALSRGYASAAVMPLNAEGKTLGVLSIYSRVPDSFADEEVNLLLRLADDLAHGIQTLRLREARRHAEADLKANLSRFALLADSANRLLQASHPQEVIPALCRRVMEQLDCDVFFNFMLDEASDRLHMNAYAGISDEDAHTDEWLVYGTTISGTVARDGVQIVLDHVQASTDPRTGRIRGFGLNAYACFPMLGPAGKVIGTLSFGTRTRDALSEADVSLIKAITDQVTVAMVRVQVEKDLRKSQAELVELNQTLEKRIAERTHQLDRLNADLERRADQLRALAQELTEAEERERRRLADILHDDLQQLLVGAKLHLSLIPARVSDPATIADLVAQVTNMIDETIGKSRGLAHDLSPPLLRQQGLIATLDWLCRQVKTKYGLNVSMRAEIRAEITETLKVFLFRAAQEMLFNVVKHASVSDAQVIVEQTDGHVRMTVSDRGKGFVVQEGVPSNWGTSGFGLFSIHERANLLGGRLMIDSAPGQGSRFTLEVPIEPGVEPVPVDFRPAPPAERVVEPPPPMTTPDGRQPLRVMIVDDHPVMRQGLAAILLNEPDIAVVGEAEDGRQALDIVQSSQPDVIIMDVSMPIMDGIEATRQIKREWPAVRVIGLSMFEEEDLAQAMIEVGAESYVSKSLGLRELVDTIRAAKVK